jgi:ribonucleoside-diphosphate reductase alpha chain
MAVETGAYETFIGSPASQWRLQPDLWNIQPITEKEGTLNWTVLKAMAARGLKNSLLIAPMPTASTSQILGYTECFEPMTTNIYARRTLAGEFVVINRYLMEDLMNRGLWSQELKQKIIGLNGSVQGLAEIPEDIQALYKTGWEIKQRTLIDMAAARGPFICQSQSLNLFLENPTYAKLTSMHFYGWKAGLKTGCYYLRTKAPVMAQKFTIDPTLLTTAKTVAEEADEESNASGASSSAESDDEDAASEEDEPVLSAEEKKKADRAALLKRLALEYEESQKDNCVACSS